MARSIVQGDVELARPVGERVWNLPDGLAFWCPLQARHIGQSDGDEDGALVCVEAGTRVFPTGHEKEPAAGAGDV